ncbi:2OG-Fe(II) oxygenase [Roseateles chitinivorans]|uniref:2OG-Fe(II) oxygenase n=1 Tax=Roseateles chitinivorans TaxID=2917965 RepID=UPI003D667ECB
MSLRDVVDRLDWPGIEAELGQEGFVVLPGVLDDRQVAELVALVSAADAIRQTSLAVEGLGQGERFALPATSPQPLFELLVDLRQLFYRRLVPVANHWNALLEVAQTFPDTLDELMALRAEVKDRPARSSFTRLRVDDYEALHQCAEQPLAFPLQLVALLGEPGQDFTGGEFVMTEQRPRMQSRPMVLPLRRGDLAIITVARRPHQGSRGYYRVNLKHAISRVRSGERIGLELLLDEAIPTRDRQEVDGRQRLLFHDAT